MWATLINNEWFISSNISTDSVNYSDGYLRGLTADERTALGVYPVNETPFDATANTCTGYTYDLVNGEVVGTPTLVPYTADQLKTNADWAARSQAIATLADLDSYIPRGLEDTWAALNFDTTKLPAQQQARLTAKAEARTTIAATAYLVAVPDVTAKAS